MASVFAHLVLAALVASGGAVAARADVSIPPQTVFVPLSGTLGIESADWSGGFAAARLRWTDPPVGGVLGAGDLFDLTFGPGAATAEGDGWLFWSLPGSEAASVLITDSEMAYLFTSRWEPGAEGLVVEHGFEAAAWSSWLRTDSGRSFEHAVFMVRFAQLPGPGTAAVLGALGALALARRR